MDTAEKVAIAGSIVGIVVLGGVLIFLFFGSAFSCIGQSCLPGPGPGPFGQPTYSVYADVISSNGIGVGITGQVLPSASSTGEAVKSCQWFVCAATGASVSASIVVTSAGGQQAMSSTWNFKLGIDDKEEYIWKVPGLTAGTYTVTITERVQGLTGYTVTASAQFTVPLSSPANFSS